MSQLEYKGDTPSAENRDAKESTEAVQNDEEKRANSEHGIVDTPAFTKAADKGKTNSALEGDCYFISLPFPHSETCLIHMT